MKRRARRISKILVQTWDDAKSAATNFRRTSNRYSYSYSYSSPSTNVTSTISPPISDTEDDPVFEPTTIDEVPMDVGPHGPIILIPCEFCDVQQSEQDLIHHQSICQQNPDNAGTRRNTTTNEIRRRVASDITSVPPPVPRRIRSPTPSAPPRSRTPSPTAGYTIPEYLVCPITHEIFRDPVVATDGHTYERKAIEDSLKISRKSPMTRQHISIETMNPNLVIKNLADDFRQECERKKKLYKYRLDIDVKKREEIINLKTNTRTIYRAEWIKKNSTSTDSKIILTHLTGENAQNLGEMYCKLILHPNIVRTFGRVEHNDIGILLLQEYLPEQTLAKLIEMKNEQLSITMRDYILHQICCALEYLINQNIIHGNIKTENIFIYQLDENPENILVKLTNFGDIEKSNNQIDITSEKSDIYAFGLLAQQLYASELATNDEDLIERQHLIECCLQIDLNARPTFNQLTKSIPDLICKKKFLF